MIEYDFYTGLDSIATSVGKLGSLIPLAALTFFVMQQDKKIELSIKASSDILQRDIKANSDASKVTMDQLAKDIKANSDASKVTMDQLAKDLKSMSDQLAKDSKVTTDQLARDSKVTTDQLAKDLKSNSDQLSKNIMDLATIVNGLAKRPI